MKLAATVFDNMPGGTDPALQQELAERTAWALLGRVRDAERAGDREGIERVIAHAADNGVDDIAELWSHAHSRSLAGVLWRLYLVRAAIGSKLGFVTTLYRLAVDTELSVNPAVVGISDPATPEEIEHLADEILRGVFVGDFAAALERAAAYCRVIALGSALHAEERAEFNADEARDLTARGLRYSIFGDDFQAAATAWRQGQLD